MGVWIRGGGILKGYAGGQIKSEGREWAERNVCWLADQCEGGEREAVRWDTFGAVNSHARPFAIEVRDPHVWTGVDPVIWLLFAPTELKPTQASLIIEQILS